HLNHSQEKISLGVLLCINGTGIQNSWLRKNFASTLSYNEISQLASTVPIGSEGVSVLPFGNGAERVLQNKNIGSQIIGLDFNRHTQATVFRSAQEGIVFTFKYGIDIMKEMGLNINVIRAGKGNIFLSPIFRDTLANITGASIELYETDGAQGAARGAAIGCGTYLSFEEAFASLKKLELINPKKEFIAETETAYSKWLGNLEKALK
ncbi:MAG: FGGY-family carbohydrate kinase, partial [Ignavibacteria bacterium]|nr:FGGY-family carbohydrate kinase [Ignavibacteria bacterium]